MQDSDRLVIWRVRDDGPEEWEVVELSIDPTREPNTLMLSTLEACKNEYPEAEVECES